MKKFLACLLTVVAILSSPSVSSAASPWAEQEGYLNRAAWKLDFGLLNLFGGWLEVVREPWRAIKNHEGPSNVLKAKARGIGNAVIYTAGGALHLATFPITSLDVPLPGNGVKAHQFPSQYPAE